MLTSHMLLYSRDATQAVIAYLQTHVSVNYCPKSLATPIEENPIESQSTSSVGWDRGRRGP